MVKTHLFRLCERVLSMQVLVLGGNGFIGSHLVDQLLSSGNKVRVYDRGPEKFRDPLKAVEYFAGEFNDSALLAEAMNGVDIVYHLISTTVPSTSNLNPVEDINGNLINTVKLLDLMRQQEVNRIVYLSSGGTVYGKPESSPIVEEHPLRPISSYGVVKVSIENYLHMYHDLYGIDYVSLRASNPYGVRQGHAGLQGVIGTYINRLFSGSPIEVWGTGEVVRDFIYVEDLARLGVAAGHSKAVGCYNAGYGKGASILEIIDIIAGCSKIDIQPVFKPGRSFDVPHAVLNIEKAKAEFGWAPQVSLEEGIARTIYYSADNLLSSQSPMNKAA